MVFLFSFAQENVGDQSSKPPENDHRYTGTTSVLQACCAVTPEYGIPGDFVKTSTASLQIKISTNDAEIRTVYLELIIRGGRIGNKIAKRATRAKKAPKTKTAAPKTKTAAPKTSASKTKTAAPNTSASKTKTKK